MKKVLVTAQKGGVFKTGLSDQLAFSLDATKTPYSFYDLDAQGGALHQTTESEDAVLGIIDTPGYLSDDHPSMIADADVIVLPTRASVTDMPGFSRIREMVKTYAPQTPVVIVLTAWNRYTNCKSFSDWLVQSKREQETLICLPQSEMVPRSAAAGVSITDYAPRSLVAKKTREFTNAVRRLAGLPEEEPLEYRIRSTTHKEDRYGTTT